MKVAVSSTGDGLESEMDARFGRCAYFIVAETEDMSFTAHANTHAELSSGAGIQSAGFLADQGVRAVLTGNCGPKASQVFGAAGIAVYSGYTGTVKDALEIFKQKSTGQSKSTGPDRPVRTNTPQAPGAMGGGRGMGGGCGRGMGGGRGRGGGCGRN